MEREERCVCHREGARDKEEEAEGYETGAPHILRQGQEENPGQGTSCRSRL